MSTAKVTRPPRKPRARTVPTSRKKSPALQGSTDVQSAPLASVPWHQRVGLLSALSCVLLWAALPPLSIWPLAWIAPVGWLLVIRREQPLTRRDYITLWLTGVVFWAVLLQGIRLAHWGNYFGLALLASYLGVYTPLFAGISRAAVMRLRVPLPVAAGVVWVALEFARAYMFTGFSLGMLAHTLVSQPILLQVCDLFGAYGVSFLLMYVTAGVVAALPGDVRPPRWRHLLVGVCLVFSTLAYGAYRQREAAVGTPTRQLKAVLVQGNMDVLFDPDVRAALARNRDAFEWHVHESIRMCQEHPDVQLVVWAESMFTGAFEGYTPEVLTEGDVSGLDPTRIKVAQEMFAMKCRDVSAAINRAAATESGERTIALIAGDETSALQGEQADRYNSALLVGPDGELAGRYYKMHPVMFGEYVPFGKLLPFLYALSPMGQGLTPGEAPASFEVADVRLSPSICFESTVPQLIRRQVAALTRQGSAPDVLVNLTNDGWFWGSTILDLHFNCSVFRAIENRTPVIIAANTGFTAHIDSQGRVIAKSPRRENDSLLVDVRTDSRTSVYQHLGDWPAFLCLLGTCGIAWYGYRRRNNPLGLK